ncbi:MAG: hypothetical protein Greene041619_804 [Candidatus Peregrinibacteria bacterium Greene0416_19]|nr:MAG: hypothetical protein Greene041619_804 [Candidatus Peregrinibacteria bacterium Greene0416_19]
MKRLLETLERHMRPPAPQLPPTPDEWEELRVTLGVPLAPDMHPDERKRMTDRLQFLSMILEHQQLDDIPLLERLLSQRIRELLESQDYPPGALKSDEPA